MSLGFQVLAEENQRAIVDFCKKEGLVLLADEVGEFVKFLLRAFICLSLEFWMVDVLSYVCQLMERPLILFDAFYAGIPGKCLCAREKIPFL